LPRAPRQPADDSDDDAFQPIVARPRPRWDDEEVDPEQSTYSAADHGPSPVPDWVITDDAARQHERGIIKSGKEADVHLVERVVGDGDGDGGRFNLLAAKRYRDLDERALRKDAKYRARLGDRRVDLAIAQGTRAGLSFRAQLWLETEFDALARLWEAGCAVPYPVQKLGVELMMEYLGDEEEAAPRLVNAVAELEVDEVRDLYDQLVVALRQMTEVGLVHGDLSPYNLLVWNQRLYVIDLPQAVDPIAQPDGLTVLLRDIENLCRWFTARGVEDADPVALYRELLEVLRLR
jgi:RIO kinase 1